MKTNAVLRYINTSFNHPLNIIKQIPLGVQCRLSQNSSTEDIYNEKKKAYISAFKGGRT